MADTWRRSAVSGVIAVGVPAVVLLLTGHLPLAFFTAAGGLCAAYAHGLPYVARGRALGWVLLGMLAGTGIALTTAALTTSAVVRVLVLALLAGLFKLVCDASRIGPPGNVIFTFIAAAAGFLPVRLADIPAHLLLVLCGGALAWLVCMAPALVRPHDPERFAVSRALAATARLLRLSADGGANGAARARAEYDATALTHAAWRTVRLVPTPSVGRAAEITALIRLLVRAESLAAAVQIADRPAQPVRPYVPPGWERGWLGVGADTAQWCESRSTASRSADADLLDGWSRQLRTRHAVPVLDGDVLAPVRRRSIGARRGESGVRRVIRAFRPSSPGFQIALRVAVGAALAGLLSVALGVNRPYWAVMTAAVLVVANTSQSWHRTVQRVLGSLVGLGLFTVLVPVMHSQAGLVALSLICYLALEATISRNYWVASIFVTPMSLVMVQFAGRLPSGHLALDRWIDTCMGAVVAVLICFTVPNRRAESRVAIALRELDAVLAHTQAAPAQARADRGVRERVAAALVELRDAADIATGEWWSVEAPQERIIASERAGHRLLAQLPVRTAAAAR
ncbi:FUSC family protein [Nocardia alni]|uniref:FUSC family protein n=1 Tax=Nocardia alni TaxID=2815723 RepID=UPI001C2150C0|nr:FUSC family protein [Nocardia alni]